MTDNNGKLGSWAPYMYEHVKGILPVRWEQKVRATLLSNSGFAYWSSSASTQKQPSDISWGRIWEQTSTIWHNDPTDFFHILQILLSVIYKTTKSRSALSHVCQTNRRSIKRNLYIRSLIYVSVIHIIKHE